MRYLQKPQGVWVPVKELPVFNDKDLLPNRVYTVMHNKQYGFFLQEIEDFKLPEKMYGKTNAYTDKILSTFHKISGQLGVFLEGRKGSGKTLLAKNIAIKSGYPCIVVNQPWAGEVFMAFIQSIHQPAVILWDEFEKVYDRDSQNSVLTLFDGMYSSRKIMIITVNDKYAVGQYFRNRPGRFRYAISFGSLEKDFIQEYLQDHLKDSKYADDIIQTSIVCKDFNFDILQTLVHELNLHGGEFEDALDILNIEITQKVIETWDIKAHTLDLEGKKAIFTGSYRDSLLFDLERGRDLKIYCVRKDINDRRDENYQDNFYFDLRMEDIVHISEDRQLVVFESDQYFYGENPVKIEAKKKTHQIESSVYGSHYLAF